MKQTEVSNVSSAPTELFIVNHILVNLVLSLITNSPGTDCDFIQTFITFKYLLNILCQQIPVLEMLCKSFTAVPYYFVISGTFGQLNYITMFLVL